MPGETSMYSEASPGSGRKPCATVPRNAAYCAWRLSRNTYARRSIPATGSLPLRSRSSRPPTPRSGSRPRRSSLPRRPWSGSRRSALTPIRGPTVSRISATSNTVAPPLAYPVLVFTKSAFACLASWQAITFSRSVRSAVSMITLLMAPDSWQASLTAAMSARTWSCRPDLSAPMLMTMSISRAPSRMTERASWALISGIVAPNGKPMTLATGMPVPLRLAGGARDPDRVDADAREAVPDGLGAQLVDVRGGGVRLEQRVVDVLREVHRARGRPRRCR